jgi:hypothetical protein
MILYQFFQRTNKNGKEAVTSEDKEMKIQALRDELAQNGHALRSVLMNQHIQAHYMSPMTTEQEMAIESILSEMPEDDLKAVAIVQNRIRRIHAGELCSKVDPTHTQSAKGTKRRQRREPPWWNRNNLAVFYF